MDGPLEAEQRRQPVLERYGFDHLDERRDGAFHFRRHARLQLERFDEAFDHLVGEGHPIEVILQVGRGTVYDVVLVQGLRPVDLVLVRSRDDEGLRDAVGEGVGLGCGGKR